MNASDLGEAHDDITSNCQVTMDYSNHGNTPMETNIPHNSCSPLYEEKHLMPGPACSNSVSNCLDGVEPIVSKATAMSPAVTKATTEPDYSTCMPEDAMNRNGVSMATMQTDEEKPLVKLPQGGTPKDVTVEHLEFDGNTVLCRVCGDKASGFHYGVHACEGCKGFFRRSIQQKIQYRPCLKNQMCNIMRVNRNRCQYCRLRKCIAVGMSRDAVRFGRVPKREKAKIMEQMQKVNAQLQGNMLNDVLDNPTEVVQHIISAHMQSCEFTRSKFRTLFEKAWEKPHFVDCPAHMACPLNPTPDQCENIQKWDEFSSCFTPAIRSVVNFAKSIPGFSVFSQEDQVTLLKAGTFEVLLVHLACLFDTPTNTMMFTNGKLYRKCAQQGSTSAGFLLDSMFDFADRLNQLHLTDEELALFSAMVIVASDRPGLRYQDQVERVHSIVSQGLQSLMKTNHQADPAAFSKLLLKIPDLRTLNTLHSEKLLGLTVPQSATEATTTSSEPLTSNSRPVLPPIVSHSAPRPPIEEQPITSKTAHSYGSMKTDHHNPSSFPPPFPSGAMLRCPVSLPETPPCAIMMPQLAENRAPGQPIIPHQVAPDSQEKELILQTPLGAFHRYAPSYNTGLSAMIKMEAEINAKANRPPLAHQNNLTTVAKQPEATEITSIHHEFGMDSHVADHCPVNHEKPTSKLSDSSAPEDFIDIDLQKATTQKTDKWLPLGKNGNMSKTDMRRVMTDPMVPEGFRKRLLEHMDYEIDPKMARMWDYDMRSSRSNSLSSSSSQESSDSAYRTISNPATPRSAYELSRSPYASPGEITLRHPLHQSSAVSLPKVTEERCEVVGQGQGQSSEVKSQEGEEAVNSAEPGMYLPTLRNMLIAGRTDRSPQENPNNAAADCHGNQEQSQGHSQDNVNNDTETEQNWMHKKLKLKQCFNDNSVTDYKSSLPPMREKAASFSTAVSRLRQEKMAPPLLKPVSREAPPRLTTKPPDSPPTFGSMVSRVMEAALLAEQQQEEQELKNAEVKRSDNLTANMSRAVKQPPVDSTDANDKCVNPLATNSHGEVAEENTQRDTMTAEPSQVMTAEPSPSDAESAIPISLAVTKANPTKARPSSNPAQRHPELLSRLNSKPKIGNPVMCPSKLTSSGEKTNQEQSRTPPPRLFPINDHHSSGAADKHSPPPLYPIPYTKASHVDLTDSPSCHSPLPSTNHLSTISSLKDKILKRIDSQENLARMSPSQSVWGPGQPSLAGQPSLPGQEAYASVAAARKRKYPQDSNSPLPASTAPNMMVKQAPPLPIPMTNGAVPMTLPPNTLGQFPGGAVPVNMHPAMIYNAVQQYQALQHLHVQAAHIQRQIHQMSNTAVTNAMRAANTTQEPMTTIAMETREGAGHHGNHNFQRKHSHSAGSMSQDVQPMNLTKQQQNPLSMATIKSEPL